MILMLNNAAYCLQIYVHVANVYGVEHLLSNFQWLVNVYFRFILTNLISF